MEQELKALIERRKALQRSFADNNMTDGIHSLLSDLYPDSAHYVYELLQNAEDMNATLVKFKLKDVFAMRKGEKNFSHITSLIFTHNGTKRSFNLADIDAITNIGNNSQKKTDETSIGQFGVGFKAVFGYTKSPRIHSGNYHFQILDYFYPDFDSREIGTMPTVDESGKPLTVFEIPFNADGKDPVQAFKETKKILEELDGNAILFLKNIRRIEYELPNNGGTGYVEREELGNIIRINCKRAGRDEVRTETWFRVQKPIQFFNKFGTKKTSNIAVAFALSKKDNSNSYQIEPVVGGGKTFIYFPAEKEKSGLLFNINAPFASTVARDSVRDCNENRNLIEQIASLIHTSMELIKDNGWMNSHFFEVIPSSRDYHLGRMYHPIRDVFLKELRNYPFIPLKSSATDFVKANDALRGRTSYQDIISNEMLSAVLGEHRKWIINAMENSRVAQLFSDLMIKEFSSSEFASLLNYKNGPAFERYIIDMPDKWFERFYSVCKDNLFSLQKDKDYISNLKRLKIFKSADGKMYNAYEIYMAAVDAVGQCSNVPVLSKVFMEQKNCVSLFEELGIRKYGPRVEIDSLIEKYSKDFEVDDTYFADILKMAKYAKEYNDIDFSEKAIFYDDDYNLAKASDLVLSTPYIDETISDVLAEIYNMPKLNDDYSISYQNSEDKELFFGFITKCKIVRELKIEKSDVHKNPYFTQKLSQPGKREVADSMINIDYEIPGMKASLQKRKSIQLSKVIWDTLVKYGASEYKDYNYHIAVYAPNASADRKESLSSLMVSLRQTFWIPDAKGEFHKPIDPNFDTTMLHPLFKYDKNNNLLKYLGIRDIGSITDELIERVLSAKGQRTVSEEDYQMLCRIKDAEKRRKEKEMSGSIDDLLSNMSPEGVQYDDEDEFGDGHGAVRNASKRATNIEKTFRADAVPSNISRLIRLMSSVSSSNKEEKRRLEIYYKGHCQMCNTKIRAYNGDSVFIAQNILPSNMLPDGVSNTEHLAWNSLCLCPNCAAKYLRCAKNITSLKSQIENTDLEDDDDVYLRIELDGNEQLIKFVQKHFIDLKTVLPIVDEEMKRRMEEQKNKD